MAGLALRGGTSISGVNWRLPCQKLHVVLVTPTYEERLFMFGLTSA